MNFRELTENEALKVPFKKELVEKPKLLVSDKLNTYFDVAKEYALKFSSDIHHIVASIIISNEWKILWMWTNSSFYHENNWCRRKDKEWKALYKSWEWYDVCPGCNPETSHSELLAIRNTFLFKILEIVKNKKDIKEKYWEIIKDLDNWISWNNLVSKIDYKEFMDFIKNILWENEFLQIYSEIEEKLNNSTLYMFWHYWACETCWNNCKKYWIKNIIVQKEAFNLHR